MSLVDIVTTASLTAVSKSSARHTCNNANCRNNPARRKKDNKQLHGLCGSCVESREQHRLRRLSRRRNYLTEGKMKSANYTSSVYTSSFGNSYVHSDYSRSSYRSVYGKQYTGQRQLVVYTCRNAGDYR